MTQSILCSLDSSLTLDYRVRAGSTLRPTFFQLSGLSPANQISAAPPGSTQPESAQVEKARLCSTPQQVPPREPRWVRCVGGSLRRRQEESHSPPIRVRPAGPVSPAGGEAHGVEGAPGKSGDKQMGGPPELPPRGEEALTPRSRAGWQLFHGGLSDQRTGGFLKHLLPVPAGGRGPLLAWLLGPAPPSQVL